LFSPLGLCIMPPGRDRAYLDIPPLPMEAVMRSRVLLLLAVVTTAAGCAETALTAPDVVGPQFDHTPGPTAVTIAGNLQSELGCPGDWQPECATTGLAYDAADDAWQATFAIPAGAWEYKAAVNGAWTENYPVGNVLLSLAAPASVKFYYSHATHWVTSSANAVIATVPGNFQSELGCAGDWEPDCLRSWLQDPDGDGTYEFVTTAIPAGAWEAKVAIAEAWDENYGQDGVANGPNIPFNVPSAGLAVTFSYDAVTHVLSIDVAEPPATVEVNSTADPGDGTCDASECTLREALATVAAGGEVTFAAGLGGTIALSAAAGQLVIDRAVRVVGPGADQLQVRGNRDDRLAARVLFVNAAGGDVEISDLALTKGYVGAGGGCIQSEGSRLFLVRVVVAECESFGAGGGIGTTGTGANGGYLSLVDVTVRDSWAANGGGGVFNNHSSVLEVSGSTISGNEGRDGGGIGGTGSATIVNTTISGNRARGRAGGLDVQNATVTVAHATIVGNESDVDQVGGDGSGGGVFFYGDYGALVLRHTIVAGNTNGSGSGPDCAASAGRLPITSAGYNLFGDATGCELTGAQTGDVVGVDPLLGPLADNGGATATHLPLPGSPARNAGDPAFAPPPTHDQRGAGFPRVQNDRIDIGAVEAFYFPFSGFLAPIVNPPAFNSVNAGQTVPLKFGLGGYQGMAIFAAGYPTSTPTPCPASLASSSVSAAAGTSASLLTYDAETESYSYLWRTDRRWAGTCRKFTMRLIDGAEYSAFFRFR
jgi:CSLREA domain-containing protein